MHRILFVCLGNICRSPAAEGVFVARARAAGVSIAGDSAGTSGWHVGDPPYPPMIRAAAARGYDLAPLQARQAVPMDFESFDLILAMDRSNLAALEAMRPRGNTTPLRLFLSDVEGIAGDEVPDPWYTGDFEAALDLIEAGAAALVSRLVRGG